MRLFVVARHAQSTLNLERRVNGDPARVVELTELGRHESQRLGLQIANVDFDVCVHTRFGRTEATARIALEGRDVPFQVEPLLDDIDIGDLEGETIERYREWKHGHARSVAFPGGESLDDAARRYALAFRKLLESPHERVLVICHEIPLRYALNGALGSDSLDGPVHELENAQPFLFEEGALARAVVGIERLVAKVPA